MKLYDKNGWVDWDYICNLKRAFIMVVGPRGTGKTYGLMKWLIQNKEPFVYLRRLQTQLDLCATISGNPFRKLCDDLEIEIKPFRKEKLIEFKHDKTDSIPVAIGCALSTVATVRGFDFSGYNYIVFDECIPMSGEKPIKDEFNAFLNLYETVNRNRELAGEPAVKCIMLGNANTLVNPYFTGWKFTKTALKMISGEQMIYHTPDKSRTMILLMKSPISEIKRGTALYQNANNGFISMAIDNAFRTDQTVIASKPIAEYNHIVSIGEIGIYKHKSKREYYVSALLSTPYYEAYGMQWKLFLSDYYMIRSIYMVKHNFVFESYEIEILFREYLKLNN